MSAVAELKSHPLIYIFPLEGSKSPAFDPALITDKPITIICAKLLIPPSNALVPVPEFTSSVQLRTTVVDPLLLDRSRTRLAPLANLKVQFSHSVLSDAGGARNTLVPLTHFTPYKLTAPETVRE
jgi:hypothetical protein